MFGPHIVGAWDWLVPSRRWLTGDVHDGGPEEVLRRHEEDGQEEARESNPTTSGEINLTCSPCPRLTDLSLFAVEAAGDRLRDRH